MWCLGPKRERCRCLGVCPCPLFYSGYRATEYPILEICHSSIGLSSSGSLACCPSELICLSPDVIDDPLTSCLSIIPCARPARIVCTAYRPLILYIIPRSLSGLFTPPLRCAWTTSNANYASPTRTSYYGCRLWISYSHPRHHPLNIIKVKLQYLGESTISRLDMPFCHQVSPSLNNCTHFFRFPQVIQFEPGIYPCLHDDTCHLFASLPPLDVIYFSSILFRIIHLFVIVLDLRLISLVHSYISYSCLHLAFSPLGRVHDHAFSSHETFTAPFPFICR
ncbi:hypothetical protein QCA50_010905 [Cerrena zonata]|uniref:Uncharacterized protein n=1 Tax=Cerrena zonata TaxID=2478898 RepID=A0AAW0FX70_9APHY